MAGVERAFHEARSPAIATLVRAFGDIDIAEDAVQDAFAIAMTRWPEEEIPANPVGWIITTARNRAVDAYRRSERGRQLEEQAAIDLFATMPRETGPIDDDQLRLIFTCCHPALSPEYQVALTLRLLGGLEIDEIARSFLVRESAMAKRLVRAKHKIKAANIPYRIPGDADLPDRLNSVLTVLYLIYTAGSDDLTRNDLRREAIRLTRSMTMLMPDEAEVAGLLALILLNESRTPARASHDHVLLQDQDRSLWDKNLIDEGLAIVRACIRRNRPGPFQIQAAIQAVHAEAADIEETDWSQIVTLYDQLMSIAPTPVVSLNRAIAISEASGPGPGLVALDGLSSEVDGYHLFHAARGKLLREMGKFVEANEALSTAIDLAPTARDRRFLESQVNK